MNAYVIALPIRLTNPLNGAQGRHWATRSRPRKVQRTAVRLVMAGAVVTGQARLPCVVTVTRIAPRALDTHDGLPASMKGVIDGVADALGIKDNDPRVTWVLEQERGAPRFYGVRIEVRSA